MFVSVRMQFHNHVDQGSQTRGLYVAPKAFCAARDAFWEFSYNQHSSFLAYSLMFKTAPPVTEQIFFNERRGGWKLFAYNSRYISQETKCKSCFL